MQILIQGSTVDISHLKPVARAMTLDLRGGCQKKNARLEFRFSCHCYSRRPANGEAIPSGMQVSDGSAHDPRNRIFSWERYQHSLALVERIDDLIESNGLVLRSRHLNFFSTHVITTTASGADVATPYYIFMAPTKKQDKNQPPKLDIFVESAYPNAPSIPGPVGVGAAVPLSEMLGRAWVNGGLG